MPIQPMFEGAPAPSLRLSAEQEIAFSHFCRHIVGNLGVIMDITPQPERTGTQSALTLLLSAASGRILTLLLSAASGRILTLRLCVSGFVRWPELTGSAIGSPLVVHVVDAADAMALAAELHRRLLAQLH